MASIYNPKIKIVRARKISTKADDKENGGSGKFCVTAEVTFYVYGSNLNEAKVDAMSKLDHALSWLLALMADCSA